MIAANLTKQQALDANPKAIQQINFSFYPDPAKQAQEVIFSRKKIKANHPEIFFNNSPVFQSSSQKHLGIILDNKLNFSEHIQNVTNKTNKTIGLL